MVRTLTQPLAAVHEEIVTCTRCVGAWSALGVVGQVAWIWKLLVFHPPSDYPP